MKLFAYKPGSKSAKDLSRALGIKRLKHEGSRWKPRRGSVIINWGSSQLPARLVPCHILNNPLAVSVASNKLRFFQRLAGTGVRTPEFTTDLPDNRDCLWLARTVLTGHSGAGIVLVEPGEPVPPAPLYVRYIKKQQEYRVHVFRGEVVDIQRKARDTSVPDEQVNWKIRNHGNGFIFARNEDHQAPEDVSTQACAAVRELGLDFGAVDVVYNGHENMAYVLEVNTAPGLTGSTLDGYVERFRGLL